MPGYKAHLTVGAVVGAGGLIAAHTAGLYSPEPHLAALCLGAACLGALLPDVDTDSKGQNLIYAALVVADVILLARRMFEAAALLGLAAMLPAVGRHRGWTHSLLGMLVLPAPILAVGYVLHGGRFNSLDSLFWALPVYASAVAGTASHLVLDRLFRMKRWGG